MSRRLDIGVASYKNPHKLRQTLKSIRDKSTTDWRCFIIHNPSEGQENEDALNEIKAFAGDPRFIPVWMHDNVGYAGAVNELFSRSDTEYFAYCDNDIEIGTHGWDEKLCKHLDMFHEIGMIFPNGGVYAIDRGQYTEVMWGVGFCFAMNHMAASDVSTNQWPLCGGGVMDESIGHQNEADLCLRVRMAGWKCAALPSVSVSHHASSTNDPASIERINRGVVEWVDKWNNYFNGRNFNYHSANVTRFEDWPPNALYLEEYWKLRWPDLNRTPEVVTLDGREYDLIKVPRFKDFYRGRII